MARPIAGGDDHHFPPTGGPQAPRPFAVKRRTDDGGDDLTHDHVFRLKRPKYIQYNAPYPSPDDHVAFTSIDVRRPSPNPPSHAPTHDHNHHHHSHHHNPRHNHHPSTPPPTAPPLERTASGLSIHPTPPPSSAPLSASTELLSDADALARVRSHMASFRRRFPDSKHERILRSIIRPRHSHSHEAPLDDDSLQSILSAANEVFFNGRLSQRVMWDWSDSDGSGRVGTTALRRARTRGYETLIVLSGPMLRPGGGFSRRLLISTFLHELVHCYLFICCGFRAREEGGHTRGFREIVRLIDEWAGKESGLHLGSVEADLERFRIGTGGEGGWYPCSGVTEEERRRHRPQEGQRTTEGRGVDDGESVGSGASGYAGTWWRHQAGAEDGWEEGEDRDSGFDSGGASGSGSPYVYPTADGMSWGG